MIYIMIEIFSNWIFVWLILFELNLIKFNPFFIIVFAYMLSYIQLFYLYYKNVSTYNLLKFFLINVILKFIPIVILLYYKQNTISYDDILFTIILLNIYLIILYILDTNIYNIYNKIIISYVLNQKETKSDISKLYDKIYEILMK